MLTKIEAIVQEEKGSELCPIVEEFMKNQPG